MGAIKFMDPNLIQHSRELCARKYGYKYPCAAMLPLVVKDSRKFRNSKAFFRRVPPASFLRNAVFSTARLFFCSRLTKIRLFDVTELRVLLVSDTFFSDAFGKA
jgi:hypothetical protein